jgi:hypothetical protein
VVDCKPQNIYRSIYGGVREAESDGRLEGGEAMNIFKLIEDNGLNLHGDIEHFAELVAQQEREACAKLAEQGLIGHTIAQAIRARGEK